MNDPLVLIPLIPLMLLLVWAAVEDLRARRIPNVITLTLLASGLLRAALFDGTPTFAQALAGMGVGFGLTFVLFVLGAMGGGDVKLMAAVGAWLGPWGALGVYAVAAVVGLVIVLVQAAASGRLAALFRNSGLIVVNLMHVSQVGVEHAKATGQECRSVQKPLPYAVPVLVAVAVVVITPVLVGRVL